METPSPGGVARGEANNTTSVLLDTGSRFDAVQRGIRFLQNDDVKNVPADELRRFLRQVGLSEGEVEDAFKLVKQESPTLHTHVQLPSTIQAASGAFGVERISRSRWHTGLFGHFSAGLIAGYLWEKFAVVDRIHSWLETDEEEDVATHAAVADAVRSPEKEDAEASNVEASVNESILTHDLAAQRSQIADALMNIRRIERENAAGLAELRSLLQDINMTMHTTANSTHLDTQHMHTTVDTSLQVLATDITGIRRDLSILSSELLSMSRHGSHAADDSAANVSNVFQSDSTPSHVGKILSTSLLNETAVLPASPPVSRPASLPTLQQQLQRIMDEHVHDSLRNDDTNQLFAAITDICRKNSAAAVKYGLPTFIMFVKNLLVSAENPRYKKITTSNELVRKTVVSLRGYRTLLVALGFRDEPNMTWKWNANVFHAPLASSDMTDAIRDFLTCAQTVLEQVSRLCDTLPALFGEADTESSAAVPTTNSSSELDGNALSYRQVIQLVSENKTSELPGIQVIPNTISEDAAKYLGTTSSSHAPPKPWAQHATAASADMMSPIERNNIDGLEVVYTPFVTQRRTKPPAESTAPSS